MCFKIHQHVSSATPENLALTLANKPMPSFQAHPTLLHISAKHREVCDASTLLASGLAMQQGRSIEERDTKELESPRC